MFTENIRFQIAALLILAVIVIVYSKNKKLPLMSTRWFSILLVSCSINLVFDALTVYTITHIDVVGPGINRFCHQMFIGTLDLTIMCLYFYINYLGKHEERYTLGQLLFRMTPFFIASLVVVFGELYYMHDQRGYYSYGPMADTVYISCAIYIIGAIANTIRFRKEISKERVYSIYVGIGVWVLAATIQFFVKQLLISGISLSLFVLIIYLSLENPREYLNLSTNSFNQLAYQKMLNQAFGRKRNFYIVQLSVKEYSTIHRMFGQEAADEILAAVSTYAKKVFHVRVYNPSNNNLVTIIDKPGESHDRLLDHISVLEKRFQGTWNIGSSVYHLIPNITIIECPRYAHSEKELQDVLEYMQEEQVGTIGVRTVNQYVLKKRTRINQIADFVEQAIYGNGIEMLYQPIYSIKERKFTSAEALVRLKNTGDFGFVSPEEFIPIAERKGLIMELGACIFKKVCEFIRDNGLQQLGVHYIEVNLSAIQCMDSKLPKQLGLIMERYHVPPSFINLEITETAAIESGELLERNMMELRQMGCSFSMDDFGTGYSNLSKIAGVCYDLIKLDKSLIWPCFEENGENANVILENVIRMIINLGIRIVAEGVETEEQVQKLESLKVNYLQGYYYSKPIKGEEYLAFLQQRNLVK